MQGLSYLILYPRPRGPIPFLRKILPFAKNAKNSCIFYVRFWKILRNFAFMNNTIITSYTPKAGNGRTTKRRSAIRVVIAIPHSPILLTIPSTFISGNDLQTINHHDTAARHTYSPRGITCHRRDAHPSLRSSAANFRLRQSH